MSRTMVFVCWSDYSAWPWAPEEDELLLKLHAEFGNGWALISQQLPGRPENAVKSRYNSQKRKIAIDISGLRIYQGEGNYRIYKRLKRRKQNLAKVSMQDVRIKGQAFPALPSRSSDPMVKNKKTLPSSLAAKDRNPDVPPDFGATDLLNRWLPGSFSE